MSSLILTKKNEKGEVLEQRGVRRIMTETGIVNQKLDIVEAEWEDIPVKTPTPIASPITP